MTAKSKVQSLRGGGQNPKPKAQRLRPAAVDHLASLLWAWLTLALLVAGCGGSSQELC